MLSEVHVQGGKVGKDEAGCSSAVFVNERYSVSSTQNFQIQQSSF
jgi:hypothetical protein